MHFDIKKNLRNTNINRKRYDVEKFLGRHRDEEIIIGWEVKNELGTFMKYNKESKISKKWK